MSNLHRTRLEEVGAIVRGHFVLNSGKHAEYYVNKTAGLVLASHLQFHAAEIAGRFVGHNIEAVVSPELGAIPLGTMVAYLLKRMTRVDVAHIMATKIAGANPVRFEIARDQMRFVKGKRTLVVEDILTEGRSAEQTVVAVRNVGGYPIGVGVLWNRGGVTSEKVGDVELFALVDDTFPAYTEEECPLCQNNIEVREDLGKGAQFLAKKSMKA